MNAAAKKLLSTIAVFGDNGGFVKDQPALKQLKAASLVEQHPTATGPVGGDASVIGVGVKITEAGIAANAANMTTQVVIAEKPTFKLADSVPLPAGGKRGSGKGKSIYPFEEMVVGQSFFIPATETVPNPAKSLASTATSATRRYDEKIVDESGNPVMEATKARKGKNGKPDTVAGTRQKTRHTRVYAMRPVTDGAPWGSAGVAGAACFRTA